MSTGFASAEAAEQAFYAAFARLDAVAMADVWAADQPVCCIHPGGPDWLPRPLRFLKTRAMKAEAAEVIDRLKVRLPHADAPVARLFRDAKLMEIGAGTSEIRRMLVGRELMGAMG